MINDHSNSISKNIVKIGNTVVIKVDNNSFKYRIANPGIADIARGEISSDSPIGSSILGHKTKETVEVILPGNKKKKCKILKINN